MPQVNCRRYILTHISAGSVLLGSSFASHIVDIQDAVQDATQQQESCSSPADPPAAAYSPERPLITNKSNKLEWREGQSSRF